MLREFVVAIGCLALCTGEAVRAADSATDVKQPSGKCEIRDAMLMLDNGPLHLRFRITLNGGSLSDAREAYVNRLIKSLDLNNDGILTEAETSRSPLLRKKRRASANKFLASLGGRQVVGRAKIRQTVERVGGEIVVYRQDTSSANTDLEIFKILDKDGSGVIDREEMAAAAKLIMEKDLDRDECVSFQEFLPPPDPNAFDLLVGQPMQRPTRPSPRYADMLRDTGEPLLPRRLLKKYDRNRNGRLSAGELNWTAGRVKPLDKNGDGSLDAQELRRIGDTTVDLELAVELAGSTEMQPALRVLSTVGKHNDASKRPDFTRVVFPGAVLSLAFRKVDPIPKAIENAMREFNRLDVDANGYLEKQETSQRIIFERGLFDTIDGDSDGKIFGEEMERYVAVRGEPSATSCRINIYDTGRGFFQALDQNGDGRISVREIRTADRSLQAMQRDRRPGISPTEPTRHFHIEFVRGSFQLFGPTEQMVSQAPQFEDRAAVGPIWFQRMDRNNDGDLTWNEFLGPKEVFYRLDSDRDELIDPKEAERAAEE